MIVLKCFGIIVVLNIIFVIYKLIVFIYDEIKETK